MVSDQIQDSPAQTLHTNKTLNINQKPSEILTTSTFGFFVSWNDAECRVWMCKANTGLNKEKHKGIKSHFLLREAEIRAFVSFCCINFTCSLAIFIKMLSQQHCLPQASLCCMSELLHWAPRSSMAMTLSLHSIQYKPPHFSTYCMEPAPTSDTTSLEEYAH